MATPVPVLQPPLGYTSWEDAIAFTMLNKEDQATEDLEELEITDEIKKRFWHIFRPLQFQEKEEGEEEEAGVLDFMNPMKLIGGLTACPHCGKSLVEAKELTPEEMAAKEEEDRNKKPLAVMGVEVPVGDGKEGERFMAFWTGGKGEDGKEHMSLLQIAGDLNPMKERQKMCGHTYKVSWCEECKDRKE
uniref:Uncharacterized protein n=1 Tax=Hemiselmis andersenii TaxID=464988 RepID=A0A6U4JAM1_HEMAN|mmetsp:Transcript_13903/g.32257  ORF Transcript_13903/g.32257 Transcript_13903/m.32257 type:complete len:189 (-) Transcript_13903:130-696(-)